MCRSTSPTVIQLLPVEGFQKALRDAVASHRAGHTEPNSPAHERTQISSNLLQASETDPQNLTFQDANNRSLEHQVMQMTKNSMMQSFALELIRFQLNSLQSVISERP